jgi:hypothetical protein
MGTSDDCPGPLAEPASPRQALATAPETMDTTEDFPGSTTEVKKKKKKKQYSPLKLKQLDTWFHNKPYQLTHHPPRMQISLTQATTTRVTTLTANPRPL